MNSTGSASLICTSSSRGRAIRWPRAKCRTSVSSGKSGAAPLIANKGYDLERANAVLRDGTADLVSFAALYLANPDLDQRFRKGGPFNPPDRKTFYGGAAKGYTDYPALPS